MSLRVLLADESVSIKKVMQLALQDYGVDVKSVSQGMDVLPLAKSFRPDVIFMDVLLPKKSGYESCAEVKADNELNHLPVVLMWSGFIKIDANKAKASRCDEQLEKPFDAETLRSLVRKLVPRLRSNEIAPFVQFPKMPEISEVKPAAPSNPAPGGLSRSSGPSQQSPGKPSAQKSIQSPIVTPPTEEWKLEDFGNLDPQTESAKSGASSASISEDLPEGLMALEGESPHVYQDQEALASELQASNNLVDPAMEVDEPEEFQQIPLPRNTGSVSGAGPIDEVAPEDWARQDLAKYRITNPLEEDLKSSDYELPAEDVDVSSGSTSSSPSFSSSPSSPSPSSSVGFQSHPSGPGSHRPMGSRSSPAAASGSGTGSEDSLARVQQTPVTGSLTFSPFTSAPSPASPIVNEAIKKDLVELIVRERAQEIAYEIAWKILPEVVERIVREEVRALMERAEQP